MHMLVLDQSDTFLFQRDPKGALARLRKALAAHNESWRAGPARCGRAGTSRVRSSQAAISWPVCAALILPQPLEAAKAPLRGDSRAETGE